MGQNHRGSAPFLYNRGHRPERSEAQSTLAPAASAGEGGCLKKDALRLRLWLRSARKKQQEAQP